MTDRTQPTQRTSWPALLALPVLGCVEHTLLIALGVGSVSPC